jgi:hypothetical protein
LFAAAVEQSLATAGEFVADQARDQVNRGHSLRLGLAQPVFQHCGDAAEPELA